MKLQPVIVTPNNNNLPTKHSHNMFADNFPLPSVRKKPPSFDFVMNFQKTVRTIVTHRRENVRPIRLTSHGTSHLFHPPARWKAKLLFQRFAIIDRCRSTVRSNLRIKELISPRPVSPRLNERPPAQSKR